MKLNQKILVSTLCLSILLIFQTALSHIRLPCLISDGMILQKDTSVKICGWAAVDEKITINFRDKTYHTTADKNVINKKVLIHKRRLEIRCLNPNL